MAEPTIYDELENPPETVESADYRRGRADYRELMRQRVMGLMGRATADGSLVSRAEVLELLETEISDEDIRAANYAERQAMGSIVDPGDPDSGLEA